MQTCHPQGSMCALAVAMNCSTPSQSTSTTHPGQRSVRLWGRTVWSKKKKQSPNKAVMPQLSRYIWIKYHKSHSNTIVCNKLPFSFHLICTCKPVYQFTKNIPLYRYILYMAPQVLKATIHIPIGPSSVFRPVADLHVPRHFMSSWTHWKNW